MDCGVGHAPWNFGAGFDELYYSELGNVTSLSFSVLLESEIFLLDGSDNLGKK